MPAAANWTSSRTTYDEAQSADPERMLECQDGQLTLPLIDESHCPIARKQHRSSPEESEMIHEEMDKLLERGVIRPSKSPWATHVLCVRKEEA